MISVYKRIKKNGHPEERELLNDNTGIGTNGYELSINKHKLQIKGF